jgi:hypothetical protein
MAHISCTSSTLWQSKGNAWLPLHDGATPLHWASVWGQSELVGQLLHAGGAAVDARDKVGPVPQTDAQMPCARAGMLRSYILLCGWTVEGVLNICECGVSDIHPNKG